MLSDLLIPERVKVPLASQSKHDVLRELVELAMPAAGAAARETIVGVVLEREKLLSTGIGSGIAIPHGRTTQVGAVVLAAGRTAHPLDFDSLDGKPVSVFFLLLGPPNAAGAHVRALGRISRLLRHEVVRDQLTRAATADAFLEHLVDAEVS